MGRCEKLPPQLGQAPCSLCSTQSLQKVHSNVQIIASMESGGSSLSQHSQPGFSSSIADPHNRDIIRWLVNVLVVCYSLLKIRHYRFFLIGGANQADLQLFFELETGLLISVPGRLE